MASNILFTGESLPLHIFTEKAYLNYSMYVILDRALPHIADGLKPVQRRIIYAMYELHLDAQSKPKKAARTVGDVIGKYHPHGDSACYEAMVLMAQPFSYRYPLIEGQGNWGSQDDPKSFAAMRYTEAKLSPYAALLLEEVSQGTVDWVPNFDGTLEEPKLLPARLPHILLNGTTGIAVGMATDIPPHNLTELGNACIHLLEHPEASIEELLNFIKGPDYPTGAQIITSPEELQTLYSRGTGTIRQRAVYFKEEGDIIISALPYQVSGAKILEQIAEHMRNKKITQLEDLRDESDQEHPVRLVLMPKGKVEVHALMQNLYALTDLERTYRVNINIIGLDQRPQVKPLNHLLLEWLEYRIATVKRRLQWRLDKINQRLEILEGLLIAFLNLDEVIRIIREEDSPKPLLIESFSLTERQAEAILDTKLRQLAKLEQIKIEKEQQKLYQEQKTLENYLNSEKKLNNLIKSEIKRDIETFGDERRSEIVYQQTAAVFIPASQPMDEPVTVILSQKGWIRSAKGHDISADSLNYKVGDSLLIARRGRSIYPTVLLDSTGRSFYVNTSELPSARTNGEPLSNRLKIADGACFMTALLDDEAADYLLVSSQGYGFITQIKNMVTRNKSGKQIVKLSEGADILMPIALAQNNYIALVTQQGKLLILTKEGLPVLEKGRGDRLIQLDKKRQDKLVAMTSLQIQDNLLIQGNQKLILKPEEWQLYIGEKGDKGKKLPSAIQIVESIAAEILPNESISS